MKKLLILVAGVMVLAYLAGCGNSTSNSNTTVTRIPAAAEIDPAAPPTQALLGGAVQGVALAIASSPATAIFSGYSAGLRFHGTTGSPRAMYNRPLAVTTDRTSLYVADYLNNIIRKISLVDGTDTILAGSASGLAGSQNGTGTNALFNRPNGVVTDGTYLYVTDSLNYLIRRITIATGNVETLAGTSGEAGHVDTTGVSARFNILNGITINNKYLYVTDSDNTIRMVDTTNGAVFTLAGSPGTSGSADGKGDIARFNAPAKLTTDGPNLYVTDFGNSTIRKIVLSTGEVLTFAGIVSPGGPAGIELDGTTGRTARFNQPNGITCDGFNLYVADSYDNNLRKIVIGPDPKMSGDVSTLKKLGSTGLNSITGITTDGTSLYVTDFEPNTGLNHVIRQLK